MRIHPFLRNVLPLLAIASPALLLAQFQQPTPEELKMTDDPKAPGASAVYLNREEITDVANHFKSNYQRIKVLKEKGKELATIRTSSVVHGVDTVTDIEGRTIHADGTIIPLTVKPDDLMDFKAKNYQVDAIVFTLPGVEVGSIIEYRLKIHSPDYRINEPVWDIQQAYFVHQAHYSFHPYIEPGYHIINSQGQTMTRLMYAARLGADAKVIHDEKKDIYSLDLTDIPAIPDEDWMPPLNTFKWRVEFYYTNAVTGADFWQDAQKYWSNWIQNFTNPTKELKNTVAGLVASGDTDEQKAMKIYAAVQKLDNTDFSRKKSYVERKKEKLKDIRKAEDVWKQQSGSANDIALLYVALARAAGLKVWPAFVVDRDRALFDINFLSDSQFDNDIVIVNLSGKEVYLDPGQKMCPFGKLHWKHTFAAGFRLSDQGVTIATTPLGTYKDAVAQRIAELEIDEQGNVKGVVRFIMTGPDALHWRQLALQNDQEEVKKQFNESMQNEIPEGVLADFDHFLGLEEYETNLIGIVQVRGNIGAATGKYFFLPGLFFQSRAAHPFVAQDKRSTPIDVHYARMEQDEVVYHLPPGFTVESAPQPTTLSWPNHALLKIASATKDGQITVARAFARNFTVLDPKDYNDLHDFYLKVAAADQQQLVLTRASAAKGN
ncbi:MAG: DUF3857 domain-containing protein [Terracidiphilus sp.]|jgi:hypothetical protein